MKTDIKQRKINSIVSRHTNAYASEEFMVRVQLLNYAGSTTDKSDLSKILRLQDECKELGQHYTYSTNACKQAISDLCNLEGIDPVYTRSTQTAELMLSNLDNIADPQIKVHVSTLVHHIQEFEQAFGILLQSIHVVQGRVVYLTTLDGNTQVKPQRTTLAKRIKNMIGRFYGNT